MTSVSKGCDSLPLMPRHSKTNIPALSSTNVHLYISTSSVPTIANSPFEWFLPDYHKSLPAIYYKCIMPSVIALFILTLSIGSPGRKAATRNSCSHLFKEDFLQYSPRGVQDLTTGFGFLHRRICERIYVE